MICKPDIAGEAWDDNCLLGEETAKVGEILVTREARDNILGSYMRLGPGVEDIEFEEIEVQRDEGKEPLIAYKMTPFRISIVT